jgi:hypothetical protein
MRDGQVDMAIPEQAASKSVFALADVEAAINNLDFDEISRTYQEQNEFIVVERLLDDAVVAPLVAEAQRMKPEINRNYIPKHKKGGSVSYFVLSRKAPAILSLYRSAAFVDFLSRLAGARLLLCPDDDPHACALYFYTEPGDHIGFHYDTSYYKGARYTVLVGLVERSSSRLVCQLYKDDPKRQTQELSLATEPGTFVFFNGDKLYHSVSPLQPGEERIVLTMQYVINQRMGPFKRVVSNMKDAVAYFGFRSLFRARSQR